MMDGYTYLTLCYAMTRFQKDRYVMQFESILDTLCYRKLSIIIVHKINYAGRLYSLVVKSSRVEIQRSGFDSWRYQIFWEVLDLEWDHSASGIQLKSYLKEVAADLVWKCKNTAMGIHHADHVVPSIHKSWHQLHWQAAVTRSV
jgi:hypothetical protein